MTRVQLFYNRDTWEVWLMPEDDPARGIGVLLGSDLDAKRAIANALDELGARMDALIRFKEYRTAHARKDNTAMTFQCTTRTPAGDPVPGILIRATVLETGQSYPRSSDGGGYSDVAIIDTSGAVQLGMHVLLEVVKEGYQVWTSSEHVITEDDQQVEIVLLPFERAGHITLARLEKGPQCLMAGTERVLLRGVTAFPLVAMLRDRRDGEVDAFLDWCREHRINWVRVFTMCGNMFQLRPDEGRQYLPDLCVRAAKRGAYVEAVIFADTHVRQEGVCEEYPVYSDEELSAHVSGVGDVARDHTNCMVEMCNEPMQPWQYWTKQELIDYSCLLPPGIPFTYGAADGPNDESREYCSDAVTWQNVHCDRTRPPWGNIRHVREQQCLSYEIDQYVVNDEPMNDYEVDEAQLFALGGIEAVCQIGGLHHCGWGKEGRLPDADEQRLFDARRRAWDAVPLEFWGVFANINWVPPNPVNPVASYVAKDEDSRCYSSTTGTEAYIVISHGNTPRFHEGWTGSYVDGIGDETSVWYARFVGMAA